MKIGIIGLGYVGKAVQASWLGTDHEVIFHDPNIAGSVPLVEFTGIDFDAIFICVPTPSTESGACDTSILKDTLDFLLKNFVGTTIIVKSTTDPAFWIDYKEIDNLFHIPEFLVAKTALHDYLNPKFIFVGGSGDSMKLISLLSASAMNTDAPMYFTDLATASLAKYFMNTFLAAKVTLLNQFYSMAPIVGANWYDFTEMLKKDPRMGDTHFAVPGTDGQLGYGGACFPKDVRAAIDMAHRTDTSTGILEAIDSANTKVRKQ